MKNGGGTGGSGRKSVPSSRQGGNRKGAGGSRVPGPPASRTEIPGFIQQRSPHREELRREQLIRENVKKQHKRHRKNYILYYLLLGVILAVTLIILSFTVFFKIETIRVEGNGKISSDEIIALSGIKKGDNLLRADLGKAERTILNQFISLDRVEAKRQFPSGVLLKVEQSAAAAVVRYENRYYGLSHAGRVIGVEEHNSWKGVPEVAGCDFSGIQPGDYLKEGMIDPEPPEGVVPADDANRYDTLVAVIRSLEEEEMADIGYIDLTDITTIKLYYQDRIEIRFGGISNLSYELAFVKKIIETELTEDGTYILDATLGNGYYYIRQPSGIDLPLSDTPGGSSELQPEGETSSKPEENSSGDGEASSGAETSSDGADTASGGQSEPAGSSETSSSDSNSA